MISAASVRRQALTIVAFSRSSSPMRPTSCERLTAASGSVSRTIAAASCSNSALTGLNTLEIATLAIPFAATSSATRRISSRSIGEITRPSNSWPP